jgi:hypothetical protein
MSVLSHQSAVNLNKNFWLLAGSIENLKVSSLTAGNISSGTATISSINTQSIDLDGSYLNTAGGELLLNGIPIATTDNLSSIQDWATFPAVSSIVPLFADAVDIGTSNLPFKAGYFSTIYAQNAIIQSTTLTLQETLSSLFVNIVDASTINAQVGNISSIQSLQGQISSLNANTIQTNSLSTNQLLAQAGTISSLNVQNLNVSSITGDINLIFSTPSFSTLNVQTLNAVRGNIQNLSSLRANISTLFVSTLTGRQATFSGNMSAGGGGFTNATINQTLNVNGTLNVPRVETVSSIRGNRAEFSSILVRRVENVSTLEAGLGRFSTLQAVRGDVSSLTVSSINGSTLQTFTNASWSLNPAISAVNMGGFNLNNTSNVNASNVYASGQLYGSDNRGNQGTFSNQVNVGYYSGIFGSGYNLNIDSNGTITTDGNVECIDIDAEDIVCCNVTVGGVTGLADVEIYGGTALPFDSALYVEGGVEFQGGSIHGFSAGALPVAGVNTQRISLTPLGVSMFSPTFISLNSGAVGNIAVGGAFSLAVGGTTSLASGTYIEVDTGYMKMINNGDIILSANSGSGDPGGLRINTYTTSNSLALDGLPFGAMDKYANTATFNVSTGSNVVFLESISLPRIGQYNVKADFLINKTSGGSANNTDATLYYAPTVNPPVSAFSQCLFGAPLYAMPSTQYLSLTGPITISTITGFTSTIQSTITENFSTFFSTGQTFSTFTSTFFSSIVAEGGLNLFWDGTQSQNSFQAQITRGSFYASYLGGFLPPA